MIRVRFNGWGYLFALVATGAAFAIRWALAPYLGETAVYPLFVLAVLATTFQGGMGPGMFAAFLGYVLADWFFIPPIHMLARFTPSSAMDFAVYAFACVVTILLLESLRRIRRKLEADIRSRKLLETQLHEAQTELERIVARRTASLTETVHQLETLSYSLSHDLRAPLRAMEGYARVVELKYGPALPQEGKDLLQRIGRSASRLDALIKDVLTYHRTASEPIDLHPVDLQRLIQEMIAARPDLHAAAAAIQLEPPLHRVLGHEALLTQCISNLLANALRFSAPGRPTHVRVWTQPVAASPGSPAQVCLNVQDNGIGIAPSDQQRIWDIFIRLHPRQYDGTGIGLSIVRKAAQRMGGIVGVESYPEEGSRFWVQLPAPPVPAVERPPRPSTAESSVNHSRPTCRTG